jgi:Ribbon-helix-helix domain
MATKTTDKYKPPATVRSANRIAVYLDPLDREALDAISEKFGTPASELVRRAVSEWLKTHKNKP